MKLYSAISSNRYKTWLIMLLFVVFATTVIFVFGKATGYGVPYLIFGFIFAVASSIGSYYYSDKMILGLSGAHRIEKKDEPELFATVENLCIGDGLPMPSVYVINDPSPNAFATGRDPKHAVVCVTSGILAKLNRIELEGVIAHELSHIKNYDTRLMGIVAILVGFIAIMANFFLQSLWFGGLGERNRQQGQGGSLQLVFLIIGIAFAVLSPLAATLIQLAVSRKREFLADASGVLLTRYPPGLAMALEKISNDPNVVKTASNATAHLFIVNPYKDKHKSRQAWFASLFDTHPPIEERINILKSM